MLESRNETLDLYFQIGVFKTPSGTLTLPLTVGGDINPGRAHDLHPHTDHDHHQNPH